MSLAGEAVTGGPVSSLGLLPSTSLELLASHSKYSIQEREYFPSFFLIDFVFCLVDEGGGDVPHILEPIFAGYPGKDKLTKS